MLVIRGLTRAGLQPFDFDLAPGECVVVRGPSGGGKTTLLRAIADLDPSTGAVSLEGMSRDAMPAPQWRRSVGYLATESGWWDDGVAAHFPDHPAAGALLPELGLDTEALNWPVSRLSTGERQRLALARLLLNAPRVMLLDEPTSGLDPDTTELVETILRGRLESGAGILLVTHDRDQENRLAGRRLVIDGGRVAEGEPS
jgi:ABC-type multidrug transport system ATPase subunit